MTFKMSSTKRMPFCLSLIALNASIFAKTIKLGIMTKYYQEGNDRLFK